jgi:hypothetical protein
MYRPLILNKLHKNCITHYTDIRTMVHGQKTLSLHKHFHAVLVVFFYVYVFRRQLFDFTYFIQPNGCIRLQ